MSGASAKTLTLCCRSITGCWRCVGGNGRSHIGTYALVPAKGDVVAYLREGRKTLLVTLNLSGTPAEASFGGRGGVILSTHPWCEGTWVEGKVDPLGNEGVIVKLS